jgi:chromosome segregation ATPase
VNTVDLREVEELKRRAMEAESQRDRTQMALDELQRQMKQQADQLKQMTEKCRDLESRSDSKDSSSKSSSNGNEKDMKRQIVDLSKDNAALNEKVNNLLKTISALEKSKGVAGSHKAGSKKSVS